MGQLVYLKNVTTLKLDEEKCVGCGMCLLVCPRAVLSLTNSRVEIVNRDACIECGACAQNCPTEAFSVRPGVGCAAAVINSMLKRRRSSACCTIDSKKSSCSLSEDSTCANRTICC
jgi:NAD-dependent dihydropyrimidine dehydrogenase PreA subunit